MGLFDFFKGRSSNTGDAGGEKQVQRHAEKVLDKRAMSPDRFASIEALCKLGTEEAWRALLPRFNFTVDPTITDREEKQFIYDYVIGAHETAVEPVREYLRKSNAVNWPIKMLRELLPREEFVAEMLELLKGEDTSYQKNPERKIQAVVALEETADPRIAPAITAFLQDVNEDARFHTVRTLLAQESSPEVGAALFEQLVRDDSMRVRSTIADGLVEKAYACPDASRDKLLPVLPRLPNGPYTLDAAGVLTKVGGRR